MMRTSLRACALGMLSGAAMLLPQAVPAQPAAPPAAPAPVPRGAKPPAKPPAAAPAPPAAAQAAPTPPPAPTAASPAAGAPAGAAPADQPAPAPIPWRTEILAFDNWTVTCREFSPDVASRKICSATLQIVQSGTNQAFFNWTLRADEGRLVNVFQTPTGVLIAPGLELRFGASSRRIPFVSCDSGHCLASAPMDDGFLGDTSSAETVEAVIAGSGGKGVQFRFPVKGFDKALAALRS
jgi:invasion protein IalB